MIKGKQSQLHHFCLAISDYHINDCQDVFHTRHLGHYIYTLLQNIDLWSDLSNLIHNKILFILWDYIFIIKIWWNHFWSSWKIPARTVHVVHPSSVCCCAWSFNERVHHNHAMIEKLLIWLSYHLLLIQATNVDLDLLHSSQMFASMFTLMYPNMWHDQEEWVGCRGCCFWDIGKNSVQIPLFHIVFSIDKSFITL